MNEEAINYYFELKCDSDDCEISDEDNEYYDKGIEGIIESSFIGVFESEAEDYFNNI